MSTPIYDATVAHFHGFEPERVHPTPTASDLIAQSYADLRRRHAKDRARDANGRFLPSKPNPFWTAWATGEPVDIVSGEVVQVTSP